jgi:tartrate-resistant acid phosphatase type 5
VPFVPFVSGNEIKDFMEANICGEVDLYICGHDHSRQWMVDTCDGTELIIAGAGAKTSDLGGNNPSYFEDVSQEGFVWFEIDGNTMTVQFWNQLGVMDYEGVITK